jgi:DUF1680 family protein
MRSTVLPGASAMSRLRPLDGAAVSLTDGFWAERIRTNRTTTIGAGHAQLIHAGNFQNLRLAAGANGTYQALSDTSGSPFPFLDTDVYKWLEAVGWELGRAPDPGLETAADEAIDLVRAAQHEDGYINSYVQVVGGGVPYRDLAWGHEFYCVGHLIQAGIAWQRSLGDGRLLEIAMRAADHIDREFGPGGRDGIDGHPEIEMALVELWRSTGERRYLDLASRLIELRGHGLLGSGRFGSAYWQDHAPVRTAATVAGHAVRQLYLDCGAVDVAVETGDQELLDAVIRRWTDMVATRRYVTGGLGSRRWDEAFGDPYELPPDQAYAETCAAIASVMLGWRLLLATGEPRFADAIERTMFNGMLSGVSLDGTRFFYVNPLQVRSRRSAGEGEGAGRKAWYPCACCPPNLMRLLSSWEQCIASTDDAGIQIHQYGSGTIAAETAGGPVRLEVETDYPWHGRVLVRILETPAQPWTLTMRIPPGGRSVTVTDPDGSVVRPPVDAGTLDCHRAWRAGDTVELNMELPPRVIESDPRTDATRGCVVVERGPLVYCIETADIPDGVELEDVAVAESVAPIATDRSDLGASVVGLSMPASIGHSATGATRHDIEIGAIPYFAWANRGVAAMRVWIPTVDAAAPTGTDADPDDRPPQRDGGPVD